MQIAIARHGETELNERRRFQSASDVPLNCAGRKQAEALAIWVMKFKPTFVLTSPLVRAKQTAEIVAIPLGLDVNVDGRLREREVRDYEGLSIIGLGRLREAAGHRFKDPTQDWDTVPSVESDRKIFHRFLGAIKAIDARQRERVLAVTHAGVAKSVFHEVFGVSPNRSCVLKVRNGGVLLLDRKADDNWTFLGLWNPL